MLKIKVKVGKVTNLSDARYCAGMGVALLGFPIGPHHGIDPKTYKEITDWVSGPAFVVEWTGKEVPGNLLNIIESYKADFIQVDANLLGTLPALPMPLIISLNISDWDRYRDPLATNRDKIAHLVLLNEPNEPLNKKLLSQIGQQFSVLLGSGVKEQNPHDLLTLPIIGISLEGTDESAPGMKDYSHLSEILELLEVEG